MVNGVCQQVICVGDNCTEITKTPSSKTPVKSTPVTVEGTPIAQLEIVATPAAGAGVVIPVTGAETRTLPALPPFYNLAMVFFGIGMVFQGMGKKMKFQE
jgi:hypothetical protein